MSESRAGCRSGLAITSVIPDSGARARRMMPRGIAGRLPAATGTPFNPR